MPATFRIDVDQRIVYSAATGVVDDEDIRGHQQALVAHPQFDPSFGQLWDFTEVTQTDLSSGGMWQRSHNNPWSAGSRRALVVASELAHGLARMFQIMSSDGPDEIEIFRDLDSARKWLGLD